MPPKIDKQADKTTASVLDKVYGTLGTLAEFKVDDDWTVYQERIK